MDWGGGGGGGGACAGAARRIAGARSRVRHAYPRRSNTAARQGGARLPGVDRRGPVDRRTGARHRDRGRAAARHTARLCARLIAPREAAPSHGGMRTGKNTGKALETALLGCHCIASSIEESIALCKFPAEEEQGICWREQEGNREA